MTDYVITELYVVDELIVWIGGSRPKQAKVPIGPFESKEAASAWASAYISLRSEGAGGSWEVSPMTEPFDINERTSQ
jgi:hypothetical protein